MKYEKGCWSLFIKSSISLNRSHVSHLKKTQKSVSVVLYGRLLTRGGIALDFFVSLHVFDMELDLDVPLM